MKKILEKLEKPIDIAPLIYARIVLGLFITIEFTGGLFTSYGQTLVQPSFNFSYQLTPFIKPWAIPEMMYGHFLLNMILGLMMVFGIFYRWVTPLFLLSGCSLFLMEKALYINHFYLYSLILLLFCFLPANRAFSFDAHRNPSIRVSEIPAWIIYILLFQLSIVYIFAGIAKINSDWFQAQPVKLWLAARADYPIIGGVLSSNFHAYLVAYGGLFFDLFIVPFMLFKPTRKVAYFVCCFFHISNVITFGVGTFPWFSMAFTALFFPLNSFRKWKLKEKLPPLGFKFFDYGKSKKFVYAFMIIFILLQLILPLRPHLYPGNASWREEGHFFAWRMMLRQKHGSITFTVTDEQVGKKEIVNLDEYLTPKQIHRMSGNPDLILQFAHFLENHYIKEKGYEVPSITAQNHIALNGREIQEMIHSQVDLTKEKRSLLPYKFIFPLK